MQALFVRRRGTRLRIASQRGPLGRVAIAALAALTVVPSEAAAPVRVETTFREAIRAQADGQLTSAIDGYRAVLVAEPEHDEAHRRLIAIAGEQRLPRRSAAYDEARSLLPSRFREVETTRFVILSDADHQWTRTQSQRLERAYHQFHRFTRRLDLRPLPLRHKLVCILFQDRRDYQAFARSHDAVVEAWIAGYYSPQHDRVVFYNVAANPAIVEARSTLADMQGDLERIQDRVSEADRSGRRQEARALRVQYDRYRQHLASERKRVDDFEARLSASTTIHEAVHQLLFHTNVQSSRLVYPLWISEGLAVAFETDDAGVAFGPDHEHGPRREEFAKLLAENMLIPLRELLQITDLGPADETTVHTFYHQSYALMTWMQRFRQRELRDYLMRMVEHGGQGVRPDNLRVFEAAFGDVATLEAAWLRHERSRRR